MPPLPFTFLHQRCLRVPAPVSGRTCSSLLSRQPHGSARGRFSSAKKQIMAPHFLLSKMAIPASPSSVRVGAISALHPSGCYCEAKCTNHSFLSRYCFSSCCSAILLDASAPAFSDRSSSTSRPPSSSSSGSSTSPPSSSSSSSFVEKRVAAEKTPSGASAKAGSTSPAAAGAPAKRVTGLHKICDLKGPLASFMGKSEASRIEVIKHVWDHIKRHNLQSAENKKMINADHALKPILQKDQVSMFEMNKLLSKYVQSRPITSAGATD